MDSTVEKKAFSIAEVAASLGVARSFVYLLITRGELRSFHIGRRHLVLKTDLDDFLQRQSEAQQ